MRRVLIAALAGVVLAWSGAAWAQYSVPPMVCGGDLLGNAPNCFVRKAAIAGARQINMTSTADQVITVNGGQALPFPYFFTSAQLVNCTAVPSVLTAGGVYSGPGATGTVMIPASTSYGGLSGVGKLLGIILSSASPPMLPGATTTLYFHLSVASSVAATCDVLIYGNELALPGGQ